MENDVFCLSSTLKFLVTYIWIKVIIKNSNLDFIICISMASILLGILSSPVEFEGALDGNYLKVADSILILEGPCETMFIFSDWCAVPET